MIVKAPKIAYSYGFILHAPKAACTLIERRSIIMKSPIWKTIALYTLGAFSGVAISIGAQSFAANPKNTATNESLPIESLRTMAEV